MANSTYGDSSRTGDDKYVLAQFRSNASLAWVGELRAFLVKGELKYKWFVPERHRVMSQLRHSRRSLRSQHSYTAYFRVRHQQTNGS
jgi:hypothetical protein